MRNPLRSEAEAFRFLIVVIVAALVIVGAAYLDTWVGVAAALGAVAGIVWWLMQAPPGTTPPAPPRSHKVLVVAVPGTASVSAPERATEIVVVVPALASTPGANAEETVLSLTRRLSRPGIGVRGEVGPDDPWLATEDALRTFGADEIVVAGDAAAAQQIRAHVTVPVSVVPPNDRNLV